MHGPLRPLLRMKRSLPVDPRPVPAYVRIRTYDPSQHRRTIPDVYARAFGDDPWPDTWEDFAEFDPDGVFVAESEAGILVGFAICFRRGDLGYISVVAVRPEWQRRGIASALVASAAGYLQSLSLNEVRIDAWEDSAPAMATYESLGFTVYERRMEVRDGPA